VTLPILDVAKHLADAHRHEDPATTEIFIAEDPAEVRLVEVSEPVAGSGEVLPFRFAPRPDQGVAYASVVVLLSPDDWKRVERGELALPLGCGYASNAEEASVIESSRHSTTRGRAKRDALTRTGTRLRRRASKHKEAGDAKGARISSERGLSWTI
jgi:hypothetical protein